MKYDVVIVGDGFPAVAAGALLARRDFSCAVVGEPDPAGGRSRIESRDGFTFDFGVLADRLAGYSFDKIFDALGLAVRFLKVGGARFYNGSRLVSPPFTLPQVLVSPMLGLRSRRVAAGLLWKLKNMPAESWKGRKSVADWLAENGGAEPDVAELFAFRAALGLDVANLELVPVRAFAEIVRSRANSGGPDMPLGGWGAVFGELEAIIAKNGDVFHGASVEKVVFDGKTARGVVVDGDIIETDSVILAVSVRKLKEMVPEELFAQKWKEVLDRLEPSYGLRLDLGLDRPFCGDVGPIVTLEPYTHGLAVSNIEPALAPRGCQLLSWFVPMAESEFADGLKRNTVQKQVREILDLILPGVMDHVVCERWLAMDPVNCALPIRGQLSQELPPIRVFDSPNTFMLNDAVNFGGFKGEPALRAVFEAVRLAEGNVRRL